ncbi:hypothetical protein PIB30_084639 [Stylosanthes scabra]|uniref:Uncharacterized protein n=1 Tax=Stylosanthes scabra TaxID=79078 RepID=A0ABU6TUK5_9FABA|nr:hypothetical protein [Stylosanthes scabra]
MRIENSAGKKVIDLTDKDSSYVWCEHCPFSVVAEKHFQSKVQAVPFMCINRDMEVLDLEEASHKGEIDDLLQNLMEMERRLRFFSEQVVLKEKAVELLEKENGELKDEVSKLSNDQKDLWSRVVELCGEKKEVEESKKEHGF